MIKGFDKETAPLTEYENEVLLPVVTEGLRVKMGKGRAVTNNYIICRLKAQGFKIEASRLRKLINYIRTNDIIPGLVASSNGYYITDDQQELLDYEESLLGRERAIRELRLSIARQRQMLSNNTIQTSLNF